MSNESFCFRQFTVHQDRCAMKVGTDGTFLGAWAQAPKKANSPLRILDIGTGTGLVALMMAQRYPTALVSAIDIDGDAVTQARENARLSPFSARITVIESCLQTYESPFLFDAIVCNPPFFINSLKCQEHKRTLARHTSSLSYEGLMKGAFRLLAPRGRFSLIVPSEYVAMVIDEGIFAGLMATRICKVRTQTTKPPKRALIEFTKSQPLSPTSYEELVMGSDAYLRLTSQFYL